MQNRDRRLLLVRMILLRAVAGVAERTRALTLPWRARGRLRATLPLLFASALLWTALLWPCHPALAQFKQDGNMLGSSCDGLGGGGSVALSADGTTAIVSGGDVAPLSISAYVYSVTPVTWVQEGCGLRAPTGFPLAGGAVKVSADGNTVLQAAAVEQVGPNAYSLGWVFTRSGGTWSQVLLTGNATGGAIALSADGNTVIAADWLDSTSVGAAWVFTRSGGVWSQQGEKLVGSGALGAAGQGFSAALSADGNTLILGGLNDNNQVGAAWVFTRSDGVWTQQAKLVGNDAVANTFVHQGYSVALSGDGNTAIVGGPGDNNGAGAAWVFTRSGGQWTQQGSKLVGSGAVGQAGQGWSVALSGDGNLAIVGGPSDGTGFDNETGAAWLFARSGGTWSQLQKLVSGEANFPQAWLGWSVALSADGRTAMVGAPGLVNGGSFVFIAPSRWATDTHDFNGDGKSDVLWQDTSGNVAVWLMNGAQITQAAGVANTTWTIVGQRDFNGDGKTDILLRDNSGNVGFWFMDGAQITQAAGIANVSSAWSIIGGGDFNGDGKSDILWQDTSGNVAIWLMNGAQITQAAAVANTTWTIVGTGDFDGDGKTDILLRDNSGNVGFWLMNGAQITQAAGVANVSSTWTIVGTGDFDGDGKTDILWRDSSGNVAIWFMNGTQIRGAAGVANTTWTIVGTGDFNGDGRSDILMRDASGNVGFWFMSGEKITQAAGIANVSSAWTIQSANSD